MTLVGLSSHSALCPNARQPSKTATRGRPMAAARARRPTAAAYNVDGGAAGVTQRLACLEVLMGGAVSCPLHISSSSWLGA